MTARRRSSKSAPPLEGLALEMVARRFRVLGDPQRLRILQALLSGERTVGELVDVCDCTQGNVSTHLRVLRSERLVSVRREGTTRYYAIADPSLEQLCHLVCGSIEETLADQLDRFRDDAR